ESYSFAFFFFQAEDGIRDRNVTGVQTCALPISVNKHISVTDICLLTVMVTSVQSMVTRQRQCVTQKPVCPRYPWNSSVISTKIQIGRASCRERVEITVGSRR